MLKPAYARLVSRIIRFRVALVASLSLLMVALAIAVIPITRGANPVSGTVSEGNPRVTWTGQVKAPTGDSNCGSANSAGCDNFRIAHGAAGLNDRSDSMTRRFVNAVAEREECV